MVVASTKPVAMAFRPGVVWASLMALGVVASTKPVAMAFRREEAVASTKPVAMAFRHEDDREDVSHA
jgi:hypothetical protein